MRKQRQSLAPPPECISPDHRPPRSRSPFISPNKSRRSPALFRSPHADKDKADFILPVPSPTRQHLSAQARSSTPVPPYEPPRERFTPPREVVRPSPRVSKSSKRKKTLSITIKNEPPEIDLSRLPPPSPTDDPLLLHGRAPRPRASVPTNARETPLLESTPPRPGKQLSPLNPCALDFSLPGIPSDVDDDEDTDSLKQPVFNFAAENGEDSWSSSDGSSSEQEGEYTGKFRVMKVPTKVDPPTSGTRERIEQWGRPISPFPRRGSPIPEHEHEEDDDAGDLDLSLVQPQFDVERIEESHVPESPKDAQEPICEFEVQSQEPANAPEISETEHTAPSPDLTHDNHVETTSPDEEAHDNAGIPPTYPQEVVGELVEPGDESFCQNGITAPQESEEAVNEFHAVASPEDDLISAAEIFDLHPDGDEGELVGEDRKDEETVDRALSEPPAEPQLLEERIEVDEPMAEPAADADAESEEDSSDDSDLSVVKIVSDDPWAAARAAAILKQVCSDSHARISFLILSVA